MTDSSSNPPPADTPDDASPSPPRVPRPAPVRPPRPQGGDEGETPGGTDPGSQQGGGTGGGGGGDGGDDSDRPAPARPTVPKPVRAGLQSSEEPAVEVPEREVELRDGTVHLRVRGRSRGHTSQGAADLLLLGFHRPGEEEPEREALVVGEELEALSVERIQEAWDRGREVQDPFEPTELFPETSRRGGRGR